MYACKNCGKEFDAEVVMPFAGSKDEPAHEGWVGVEECPECGEEVDVGEAQEEEIDTDEAACEAECEAMAEAAWERMTDE